MNAVLLVNTGTPATPTAAGVRPFLRRFLADRRVVELPRVLWLPLLYGVIVPLRSPRSAAKYRRIWRPEGSPLNYHCARLRAAIESQLGGAARVEQVYLYSKPGVATTLEALRSAGVRQLISAARSHRSAAPPPRQSMIKCMQRYVIGAHRRGSP